MIDEIFGLFVKFSMEKLKSFLNDPRFMVLFLVYIKET
jgi:hypothetical protein